MSTNKLGSRYKTPHTAIGTWRRRGLVYQTPSVRALKNKTPLYISGRKFSTITSYHIRDLAVEAYRAIEYTLT